MSRRRLVAAVVAVLLGAGLVAAVVAVVSPGPRQLTVTAEFVEAPGLYVGNHVDVLGVPVGTVTAIHAGPASVRVTMRIPATVAVPRVADAVLMAPDVVNDRFVQLNPAYVGGPRMADHAVIPQQRTAVPLTVDQVFNTFDKLAVALGPGGANHNGALTDLLHGLAQQLDGNGPNLRAAVVNASHALAAVSANPTQLTSALDNLGTLTKAAADNTASYQAFANDLAGVSASLASDSSDIGATLANLQQLSAQVASFAQANQQSIGTGLTNLQTFAATIARQQQALAKVFGVGPLALENFNAAVDHSAPGGPALRGRFDATQGSASLGQSVCGNQLLRGLVVATNPAQTTELDVDCLFNGALGAVPPAPGASGGPNLSLGALMAAAR